MEEPRARAHVLTAPCGGSGGTHTEADGTKKDSLAAKAPQ
jgi:hypothetical protein